MTSMAMTTLVDCLEDPESRWIQEPADWLVRNSHVEAKGQRSWESEVWDTSLALIALTRAKRLDSDPIISEACDWLIALRNEHFNWHNEPWETTMALLALLETRQYRRFEHILDSVRWLTDIIESIGLLILHYSAFLRLVLQQIQNGGSLLKARRCSIRQTNSLTIMCATRFLPLRERDRCGRMRRGVTAIC